MANPSGRFHRMGGKNYKELVNSAQRIAFTIAITIASRVVQVRDRLLGRVPDSRSECAGIQASQHTIRSSRNLLDSVYVEPNDQPIRSALLVCHGIGETVPQWFPIQRLFAERGIASLVFDYSGYGRSTGMPDFLQFEQDAIASFQLLQRLAPDVPITLLGFSMGTGVAPAILKRIRADRLVLCAGFTSFREAARSAWIPRFMNPIVPPIWSAREALCDSALPILIVQGTNDRLFQTQMAHELHACTGGQADLFMLPARSHNEPFYFPKAHYWDPIIDWMLHPAPLRD